MIPTEYMSQAVLYSVFPLKYSGANQNKVPEMPFFFLVESPKSQTLALNRESTRIFLAFKSPWRMGGFEECKYRKPWAISLVIFQGCQVSDRPKRKTQQRPKSTLGNS